MADTTAEVRFLLADPEENFFIRAHNAFVRAGGEPLAATPQPIHAQSMREVQSFLSNREYDYTAIFVNPEMGSPTWLAVIKLAKQFRPDAALFVVYDENPPKLAPAEAKKLGVTAFLPKPVDYDKMLSLTNGTDATTTTAPPESPAEEEEKKKVLAGATDADFVPVSLKAKVSNLHAQFDLFVRLPSAKYVRVVRSGELLSAERVEKYKEKGAENLFILKTEHEAYLTFCDDLVKRLMQDTTVSAEVKSEQVSGQGEDVQRFFKVAGFSEASMERARQYVANVTVMIDQIKPQTDAMKAWMSDVAAREHSVGITTVAGLMMKNIGVNNPAVANSMGVACFMHDIGLAGQPQVIVDEDPLKMNDEQKKIYFEHPVASAKLLKKMKQIPPAVILGVEQHHLRIGKQGFPLEKVVEVPNLIAELLGLSEEFIRLMKRAQAEPNFNPIAEIVKIAPSLFSPKIVDPFIRTISEK